MNREDFLAAFKNPLTWLLLVIGLASLVVLHRLLREQSRSYRTVGRNLPGFVQHPEKGAAPAESGEQGFSSLDYVQREVIPFAPIKHKPEPAQAPPPTTPAPTASAPEESEPAPKPAAPKPRLKPTKSITQDSGSSSSSSAFLPASKDAKKENPAAATANSDSKPAPAKTRSWRNPVGQSSTRP